MASPDENELSDRAAEDLDLSFMNTITLESLDEPSPEELAITPTSYGSAFRPTTVTSIFAGNVDDYINAVMGDLRQMLRNLSNPFGEESSQHLRECARLRLIGKATESFEYEKPEPSKNKEKEESEDDQAQSCAICLVDFENGAIVRRLRCQHMYHKGCIDPWLWENKTCAICRADITGRKD